MSTTIQQRPVRRDDRVPPRAWSVALLWGQIPFLAAGGAGLLLAFGQVLIGGLSLPAAKTLRLAGLYLFAFNHVTIKAAATRSDVAGSVLTLSVALLTVTSVVIVLLFLGGRRVGEHIAGGPLSKALAGAAVALPYAALCVLVSYAVGMAFPLPSAFEGSELRIGVSHLQALLWPLAIGGVSGFLGGLWAGREELARTGFGARVVGGLASGWRAFVYALALAFVGLLVVGAANPETVRGYLDDTAGGGLVGKDLMVHHALALPNQSLWVLVPAMGGCDRIAGSKGHAGAFLCYSRFPRHGELFSTLGSTLGNGRLPPVQSAVTFTPAPRGYLLFLLVPLVAVVAGAWASARRSAPPSVAEGALQGALGGVVFALLVVAGCLLSRIGLQFLQSGQLEVGPDPVGGGLLALAWGVVGGAVGAAAGTVGHTGSPAPARRPRRR